MLSFPSRAIVRPVLLLLSGLLPGGFPVQPGHTGLWFDPEHPGHGIFLHIVSPDQATLTWNVFDPAGRPLWVFGDGRILGERIEFSALQVEGGSFPPLFGGQATSLRPWGRLELRFLDCERAEFRWQPDALPAGLRPLRRLSFASGSSCIELGTTWTYRDLGEAPAPAARGWHGRRSAVVNGEILLATRDGLWRRRLDGEGGFERAGLAGLEVLFIQRENGPEGRLFAGVRSTRADLRPFFVSADGGRTWANAQSSPEGFETPFEHFVEVHSLPLAGDVLFAALEGGAGIAYSRDGGRTWQRADGASEPLFGYSCHLAILPAFPDRLYQGCEAVLDYVELRYFPIDLNRHPPLADPVLIARTGDPELPDLGNRRPNALSFSTGRPDTLYAGLEGALIALSPFRGLERVYWSPLEPPSAERPYVYVHTLWVGPRNPARILFGGGLNGENDVLHLYETRDHGRSLTRLPAPPIRDPRVDSLHVLDEEGRQMVVTVLDRPSGEDSERLRVLRYALAR